MHTTTYTCVCVFSVATLTVTLCRGVGLQLGASFLGVTNENEIQTGERVSLTTVSSHSPSPVQDFTVSKVPVCGGARLKNICSMGGPDTIIISSTNGARKTLRVSVCVGGTRPCQHVVCLLGFHLSQNEPHIFPSLLTPVRKGGGTLHCKFISR